MPTISPISRRLKNLKAVFGNLIPAEIGLDPSAPVLNMSEGGFAEIIETDQPAGYGKNLVEAL